jgi:hypothetical protein
MIPDSLSKPPPSATRPPHRGLLSIRDSDSYAEALDSEPVRSDSHSTAACGAKYRQQEMSCDVVTTNGLGTPFWAHFWAHTVLSFASSVRNRKENDARRRFFRPPPSTKCARRSGGARSSQAEPAIRLVGSVSLSHFASRFSAAGFS